LRYSILQFGAVGDGIANDTAAIQSAIDACAAAGGGTVIIPGGKTYRSGALVLCSNLELHLEMGAVLKGSDSLSDYVLFGEKSSAPGGHHVPSYENCEYNGAPTHYFLYGKNCTNIAITGFGTIDGNEEIFYGEVTKWHIEGSFYPRAPMLFLENVSHLTVRDVTMTNSAFWTVHLVGCQDVLIDGIRILNNLRMANCDGIDPDHCRNVRIANCHIECADDCIVFKNTAAAMAYGPCENITVTNCTLTSTSAAIKFGSESEALFRNILVENCVISRTNRGISLQLRDKGSIENVSFHNIAIDTRLFRKDQFWGQAEPIAITVLPRKADTQVGTVRNIRFSNIFCAAENGILLYGAKPDSISGIRFDDVQLELRCATDHEKGFHDLRPTFGVPFTEKGLHYLLAHNVSDAVFSNCRFRASGDLADALDSPCSVTDCTDLQIRR
jgi:polygalacturonase